MVKIDSKAQLRSDYLLPEYNPNCNDMYNHLNYYGIFVPLPL